MKGIDKAVEKCSHYKKRIEGFPNCIEYNPKFGVCFRQELMYRYVHRKDIRRKYIKILRVGLSLGGGIPDVSFLEYFPTF